MAFSSSSLLAFMIKSTRDDPGKVNRLIAEFPGPLCLQASPFKWSPIIAAGPAIVALLVFLVVYSDVQHGSAMNGDGILVVFMGLFFGLFVVIFGIKGLKGSLRLDVEGFRAASAMTKQYCWKDVRDFGRYGTKGGGQVVFDTKTERHPAGVAYWPGANLPPQGETESALEMESFSGVQYKRMPDNYGLSADDLARLMNSWRELAIRRT
jgi:hypothetical protein